MGPYTSEVIDVFVTNVSLSACSITALLPFMLLGTRFIFKANKSTVNSKAANIFHFDQEFCLGDLDDFLEKYSINVYDKIPTQQMAWNRAVISSVSQNGKHF